ncbi:hypothetical protein [Actinomadura latina]|uniref:Uncharacterized protein n=1 Tax=Actinomadura latina TaxID=163603 RepID=A0A846Z8W0_9ACTN|nr:hypothetical protein [Actinomadura latina]NKZ07194.1 hypothetical protein [Actinomadura latina]CNG21875.1 Uncharacterised protein [Mycobacterium tuberculosis]
MGVVDRVITERAVFDVCETLRLVELLDGWSLGDVRACTAAAFEVGHEVAEASRI